jgi:nucleotide-binding universal stress UspA family protein
MIKDVLVHLDGSTQDEERLLYGEIIASISQAHLTGLFTNPLPDMAALVPFEGGAVAADLVVQMDMEARQHGDRVAGELTDRFIRLSVPNEVRRVEDIAEQIPSEAATEARWADLFVASRPFEDDGDTQWRRLFEAVLFESGRAVLVVPPGRRPPEALRRVLVCWRDTRESARAVAEAMPILVHATRTMILVVDPDPAADGARSEPAADIAKHLDRCGAKVEVTVVASKGNEVYRVMLDHAARMSADLIVMGGYGHSRAREWLIGGVTRDMLNASPVPILIAH